MKLQLRPFCSESFETWSRMKRYMELVRQQSHEEVATAAVTSSLKLWRAPTRVELQNIVDSIKKSVTLNKVDFYNNSFTSAADSLLYAMPLRRTLPLLRQTLPHRHG